MKNKIDIKSLVFGALLGAVALFSIGAVTGTGSRTVWEFKVVPGKVFGGDERELGALINGTVAEGWEFVSASHSIDQWGFAVMRREKK